MTEASIKIFIFSALIDMGAVLYTKSVGENRIVFGVLMTSVLALLNWAAILMVTKQDDGLVTPSVLGHAVGFVVGMLVPVRKPPATAVCERCHPTTEPGSQSCDPS